METHESNSVCIGVLLEVFRKIPPRHPIGNKLEGRDGNTQQGDYVWMFQAFPHYGLLAEGLCVWLVMVNREGDDVRNLL